VSAGPLLGDGDRQALAGRRLLASVEADLLGDEPELRGHFTELAAELAEWATAGDQAVAVHLRLLDGRHAGYTPEDLASARQDYTNARGQVLARVESITRHQQEKTP